MNKIRQTIRSISGHNNQMCYIELQYAVQIVLERLPEYPQMKEIQREVIRRTGKKATPDAVSKAISRAARDIWDYGDRSQLEQIFHRPLWEQPSPKSMVFTLAEYLWMHGEQNETPLPSQSFVS